MRRCRPRTARARLDRCCRSGLGRARADLGRDFGAGLSEAELRWMMTREWARRAEDVVWRRTKLGLQMTADQIAALDAFMADAKMNA